MPLANGPTIVAPIAGQVLAEAVFPTPRHIRVIVMLTATYNFEAILEVWNAAGQVIQDVVLSIAAPIWDSEELGPFVVPANGRVRVISRGTPVTPGTLEVQASLFWRDWGER